MTTTPKLRLGPLPKTENIKLIITCPASLKADLDRYAALHAQTYEETVEAATLTPHMLEVFMAGIKDSGKHVLKPKVTSRGGKFIDWFLSTLWCSICRLARNIVEHNLSLA